MTARRIEDIAIVDSHHHLWDLSRFPYPWLTGGRRPRRFGDYGAICRDYLVADLLADVAPCRLEGSVHVQAETGADPLAESRWLADQARATGFPSKAIAKCDLAAPDAPALLAAHAATGIVAGVREPVHWSADPIYAGHSEADRIERLAAGPGLAALAERGMVLEVVCYFDQADALADLLARHPRLTVVIDHCLMPVHLDATVPPFREPEAGWRAAVRLLAALPNAHMKLSGLWMAGRALTAADIRPVVHHLLDWFGAARCLVGSNFPVDKVNVGYRAMMQAYLECCEHLDDDAVAALFAGNARALYRIGAGARA